MPVEENSLQLKKKKETSTKINENKTAPQQDIEPEKEVMERSRLPECRHSTHCSSPTETVEETVEEAVKEPQEKKEVNTEKLKLKEPVVVLKRVIVKKEEHSVEKKRKIPTKINKKLKLLKTLNKPKEQTRELRVRKDRG